MNRARKLLSLLLVLCAVLGCSFPASAASGTCEVFYFSYTGSVGSGGSELIRRSLNNMGYSANMYVNTHAYYVRRTMDEDKVFSIVSHGNAGYVVCADNTTMSAWAVNSDDNNYSLAAWFDRGALSGMKLAYFGACYSAASSPVYGNLITYATGTLGAQCAIGYKESVDTNLATLYEVNLFQNLEKGYTVYSADVLAKKAVKDSYQRYGGVDSATIAGNSYGVIK